MKAYMCVICGFVYEEEKGRPEDGIPPGTRWEAVPENWKCPECGATKSDFEMIATDFLVTVKPPASAPVGVTVPAGWMTWAKV